MKFTPETLLQIYLDGAFTEEAQAEFDALMRKDPIFVERVTQSLAERLGPVPEDLVNGVSARLDGKIGDLWNRNKPSPMGRFLKLCLGTAVALTAMGGLFFGGHFILVKLNVPAISEPSRTGHQASSVVKTTTGQVQKAKTGTGNTTGTTSAEDNTSLSKGQAQVPAAAEDGIFAGQNPKNTGSNSPDTSHGAAVLPPASTANQKSMGSISNSTLSTSPVENSSLPSEGVTAEGNSLRVAIDTDKTEKVEVTVYDANGLLIRHLYSGVLAAGEHTVDWDGKDGLGNAVLPGDYTVILDRGGKKMSGILQVLPNR